jgi:hypothetical protein
MLWGTSHAYVSDGIGILLENFLLGARWYQQPSDKFLRGDRQLLQIAHICQRVANTL